MLYRETATSMQISAPSLLVEDGTTVHLSSMRELKSIFFRPRNVTALRTLAGLEVERPARLSDSSAFETLAGLGDCVDLQPPDGSKTIGGYSVSFLRNVVATLEREQQVPDKVRWQIPRASTCGCHVHAAARDLAALAPSKRVAATPRATIAYQSQSEVRVPSFLKNLAVAVRLPVFEDIVVGFNSTLVLDEKSGGLMAQNVLAYEGARIVQTSAKMVVDIMGTLRGGISRLVHTSVSATSLKIDWQALSTLTVANF